LKIGLLHETSGNNNNSAKSPWNIVNHNKPNPDSNTDVHQSNLMPSKTFAQAVSNICDIPTSQLPKPVLKGDNFAIAIPGEEYMAGMETCKHNLHARIIWPKGSTPLTTAALRNKLSPLWKGLAKWGVSFLGKGFYEFCFSSLEDLKRVRSVPSWNLNPGVLKLFTWTRDFCPSTQNSTPAQVWLRIYGLAQEYWHPKIFFAIANSVGTPICTDSASAKPMVERSFGQYARVLMDMDVTQEVRYKVLVERKGFAFFVDLDYENIPDYCTHCRKIGHYINICKSLHKSDAKTDSGAHKTSHHVQRQEFVQVSDGRRKQGSKESDPIVVEERIEGDVDVQLNSSEKSNKEIVANNAGNLLQQNKFNALLNVHENSTRDEMLEMDKQLENEVNEELEQNISKVQVCSHEDSDDSQESEFVDATQHNVEVNHNSPISQHSDDDDHELDLAALEKRNQAFLEQYWANIVDDDDSEHIMLKDLEALDAGGSSAVPVQPNDGFQVVQKSKHKQQKKSALLSNYKTRGKTGNPKPFR
jgi:hypothetical protein